MQRAIREGSAMDLIAGPDSRGNNRRSATLSKIKASARKLFIERGYHATRSQDIAREAGLGHGTFYLHYNDKRDCFLAFVEDAHIAFHDFMRLHTSAGTSLDVAISRTLVAVYEFSDIYPGLLSTAMADEVLIDAEGFRQKSLIQRWGSEWAEMIRDGMDGVEDDNDCDPEIAGQAIVGAIHQCGLESDRMGFPRAVVIANLTRLLVRALTPPISKDKLSRQ